MKHIVFEYRDEFSHGNWNRQECWMGSLQQCIEFYGLDECEYRIIKVEDIK